MKRTISARCLAIPIRGRTHFPRNSGAHVHILHIAKVKIIVLIKSILLVIDASTLGVACLGNPKNQASYKKTLVIHMYTKNNFINM